MESRKDQLKKQIIEALKENDNDLYNLLKSQWAHRFGVENLEELNNLNLRNLNQNNTSLNNQKIDQSQENSFDGNEPMSVKHDNNQKREINSKDIQVTSNGNDKSFEVKSYKIGNKEDKIQPIIKTLIPLPPKPKYSYLNKWLLRI